MQRLVVFKEPDEFEQLKRLFYGTYADQKRALALTKAYQVRGHLPASIHLTCLVVSALHNDVPQNDLYAIRQTYAMAIIRLVNEILDSAQVGRIAAPLHALARELKLPSSFVELRHAATHEDLPTIYLLRDMARRALDWLYDAYWAKNRPKRLSAEPERVEPSPLTADEIKNCFRSWRRIRRADINAPLDGSATKLVEALAGADVASIVDVALKRNIVVPSGTSTASVIPLWGPLFVKLGSPVVESLFKSLVAARNEADWPSFETSDLHKSFDLWLDYLLPYALDAESLLTSHPRPWNALLLAKLANAEASPDVYQMAQEMAAVTGASLPPYEPAAVPTSNPTGPWKRVQNWSPRPLGVK
ncbi:Protein LAS1 [Wickerhamiella sorbophila]|uniref:Protein LAS1 n=1 Tax=Wickerhamiella sorbophila TaxID=45607 RepID=A0A2T0FG05_9ASCO|nr:Protein LAS1 [Wickerhamiella sorbophila]PRT53926.1 Protein LAS1 [Wickerhamiella sorbophila]